MRRQNSVRPLIGRTVGVASEGFNCIQNKWMGEQIKEDGNRDGKDESLRIITAQSSQGFI